MEEQARSVEAGMFSEMPKQYRERPDGGPLCQAWNDAVDAATLAHLALQKLGDMLRRKANIVEPGPCEPAPEGWNLASACVAIVRRRAQLDIDPDGRTRTISCPEPTAA